MKIIKDENILGLVKIGIVTVLFKSESVISGFVDSINKQSFENFEVLFVENDAGSLQCEDYIKNNAEFKYGFLRNTKNLGVATANNQGIDYFLAKPEFTHLLFLNNDIEVCGEFLRKHCDLLESHPEIQALAPKMFYYNSGGKIWYAGGGLSYLKGNCRHYGHNKKDILVGRDVFKVEYAPTCSLLVQADVLRKTKIRMWDELFVYFDDTVFCSELSKAGVQIYYTPLIELQHKISSSTGGAASEFSRYYLTRNWLYWGRCENNIAVYVTAILKLAYYLLSGRRIEIKAMKDGLLMPRRC